MSTIIVKKTLTDGREISINHTYGSTCLDDQVKATEKINRIIEAFEQNKMPADSKPEEDFVHYNRNCKYCKEGSSVTVITFHSDPGRATEKKLYCHNCQRTWPYTAKASSAATHDEKLIHSIHVIFKNARAKAFNAPMDMSTIERLSEVETKIIQRIIYG